MAEQQDLYIFRDIHPDSRDELQVVYDALGNIERFRPQKYPNITLVSGNFSAGLTDLEKVHALHPLPPTAKETIDINVTGISFFRSHVRKRSSVWIDLDPNNNDLATERTLFNNRVGEALYRAPTELQTHILVGNISNRDDYSHIEAEVNAIHPATLKLDVLRAFPEALMDLSPDLLRQLGVKLPETAS